MINRMVKLRAFRQTKVIYIDPLIAMDTVLRAVVIKTHKNNDKNIREDLIIRYTFFSLLLYAK